jgi:hypothetical protein
MVKKHLNKALVLLSVIVVQNIFGQIGTEYYALKKYYKTGIVLGPTVYNKGIIEPQYGEYTFTNKALFSFNAGIEYDFYPDKKWSFITGFIVALEPVYNVVVSINKEDIYSHFDSDVSLDAKAYSITSFSFPFLLQMNIQASNKLFIDFVTGLKAMYFPPGSSILTWTFHNENDTESREVFTLWADSPDNLFQGSFIIGSGMSYAMKHLLIKTNVIYVMNFQNIMEGEYSYDNMFVSAPSFGYYKLSGNYLGLLFTIRLAKKKFK